MSPELMKFLRASALFLSLPLLVVGVVLVVEGSQSDAGAVIIGGAVFALVAVLVSRLTDGPNE